MGNEEKKRGFTSLTMHEACIFCPQYLHAVVLSCRDAAPAPALVKASISILYRLTGVNPSEKLPAGNLKVDDALKSTISESLTDGYGNWQICYP